MPLPQQVVEQLGRDPGSAPSSSASGALLFSGAMLALVAVLYLGMKFGYEPVLSSGISSLQHQVATANSSISADQEQQIVNYYSQITNLKTVLTNHVYSSSFLQWLGANTEANVYYQELDLASGGRVTVKGVAKAESDVNQQIAIFESSPQVTNVAVSSIAPVSQGTGITFTASLVMNPSVFSAPAQ